MKYMVTTHTHKELEGELDKFCKIATKFYDVEQVNPQERPDWSICEDAVNEQRLVDEWHKAHTTWLKSSLADQFSVASDQMKFAMSLLSKRSYMASNDCEVRHDSLPDNEKFRRELVNSEAIKVMVDHGDMVEVFILTHGICSNYTFHLKLSKMDFGEFSEI